MVRIARISWSCAAALAVFVAWLALGSSGQAGIGFFYAIPIGLASWWFGWKGGAAAVPACVVLYVTGAAIHPVSHFGVALAVRLLAFVAVAAVVSVLRERVIALEHSAAELEEIRAALTPSLPQLSDVDAAAAFVPSQLGVSGDFYLLTGGPDGSTVAVVGDVVGHGPKAARLATFIRARLAAFAANTADPAEILTLANAALLDRPGRGDELVSAVCVRLGAATSAVSWAIAGHPPPLRLPTLQTLQADASTLPLGAGPNLSLSTGEASMGESDGVLVYTDGATDVRRDGAILGEKGLLGLLAPLAGLPASALVSAAKGAILEWTDGPVRDDLCILALRPRAGS
jgi:sigma-B regulation protein RsbU (phosphoserine phosphatase)